MHVEVRGLGIQVSEALRGHVERRLGFALDRFVERIEGAYVVLRDVNGRGRRGLDKECRIAVVLRTSGSFMARARRADAYVAVDVAARAVGRALVRDLGRRRTRSRQPPRPPALPLRPVERSAP